MGAYSLEDIEKLRWMESILGPTIKAALEALGGIDVRAIISKALHMGDDGHNRLDAASMLWTSQLAPYIAKTAKDSATAFETIKFLGENALSILNPVMAGCKSMTAAGHNIEGSTIVTIMARNGTDFGLKVSGLGDRWFTAQSPIVKALYFPGFTEADACRDIGDSKAELVEANGLYKQAVDSLKPKGSEVIDYFASDVMDMAVYLTCAWLMLQDACLAESKRAMARIYIHQHLPRVHSTGEAILAAGDTPLQVRDVLLGN